MICANPDSCPGLAAPRPGAPPSPPKPPADGAPNAHPAPALPLPRPVFCVFCNRDACLEFCCAPYVFMLIDRSGCCWPPVPLIVSSCTSISISSPLSMFLLDSHMQRLLSRLMRRGSILLEQEQGKHQSVCKLRSTKRARGFASKSMRREIERTIAPVHVVCHYPCPCPLPFTPAHADGVPFAAAQLLLMRCPYPRCAARVLFGLDSVTRSSCFKIIRKRPYLIRCVQCQSSSQNPRLQLMSSCVWIQYAANARLQG